MVGKLITLLLKIFTLPFWYIQKLFPRNKHIWLFGAGSGLLYFDNSKWLYEYVLRNEKQINAIWITRNKEIYNKLSKENKPVLMVNSLKGIITSLRAGVVFINNTPKDVNARAINGSLQIWLWHGLMMKQIGQDARLFSKQINGFKENIFQFFQKLIFPEFTYNPDYIINTSEFFTPYFSSAFNLTNDRILITGYPRNDGLFVKDKEILIEELNEKYNNPTKILYLPTWRDAFTNKGKSFNPFDSYGFDSKTLSEILNTSNSVFLNKGHNFELKQWNADQVTERFINLSNQDFTDLYRLLKDIDILITDYSSVYFDFILTGKPVILAPFDIESYIRESRPLYYDYYKEIEGIKANDWNELFEIIIEKTYYSISNMSIQKFHCYIDDHSSERVSEATKQLLKRI